MDYRLSMSKETVSYNRSLVFAWSALKVGSFVLQNHPIFYVIHKIQVTLFAFIMYK